MEGLNIFCGYCTNHLFRVGVVICTEIGDLIMCTVCRGLYHINFLQRENDFAISIKAVNLPQDTEFELIRYSTGNIPLSQYISEQKEKYAKPDIKEVIQSSVTPSDFLRKLNNE